MLVEEKMFPSKTLNLCAASLALLVAGISVGCSQTPRKAPDVSGNIRQSLDQAGFKDVSVTQDREKGVLTLGGHVAADGDKAKAESIATSLAGDRGARPRRPHPPPAGFAGNADRAAGGVRGRAAVGSKQAWPSGGNSAGPISSRSEKRREGKRG